MHIRLIIDRTVIISVADYEIGRSVAGCGKYLYMTSSTGKGLVKIGSGLHGTLR